MVQTLKGGSLEERVAILQELLNAAPKAAVEQYDKLLEMSWVYHDSALEGTVYNEIELKAALDDQVVSDSTLIPVYDEIRQHKAAVAMVKELAEKKTAKISLDTIKKIFLTLAPEENEGKGSPKYRKDMPLHRLYFHDIAAPDKINYQMRQLIEWINAPDTKRSTHTVRLAAKAHHTLLHIYPFPKFSGKVARLLMNLILMRQGYPPVVIHATERHRYYDALKTSPEAVASLVTEALAASVESAIRFFEDGASQQSA